MWTGAKTEFRRQLTAISNFIKTGKRNKMSFSEEKLIFHLPPHNIY